MRRQLHAGQSVRMAGGRGCGSLARSVGGWMDAMWSGEGVRARVRETDPSACLRLNFAASQQRSSHQRKGPRARRERPWGGGRAGP